MMKITLESILGEMSVDEFKKNYWNKKPLYIKNAVPDIQNIFNANILETSLSDKNFDGQWSARFEISGEKYFEEFLSKTPEHISKLSGKQASCLKDLGAYIILTNPENNIPEFAGFMLDIEQTLKSFTKDYENTLFIGSKKNMTPFHTDIAEVFCLQIEGKKKWRLDKECKYRLALFEKDKDHFFIGGGNQIKEIVPKVDMITELCELTMQVGDFLYIPAFLIHQVENLDELNISLSMSRGSKSILEIIEDSIKFGSPLMSDKIFNAIEMQDSPLAQRNDICARLSDLLTFFKSQDDKFYEIFPKYFSTAEFLKENKPPFEMDCNIEHISKTDRFLRTSSNCAKIYTGTDAGMHKVIVFIDGHEVSFDEPKWFNFAPFLVSNKVFSAMDVLEKCGLSSDEDWCQLQEFLKTLISMKFIILEPEMGTFSLRRAS